MARVVAGMTISLDGFIADPSGGVGRLYPDLAALQGSAYMNSLIDATGAVLMGRTTFFMGDPDDYLANYEFQVPIFILTHHPPEKQYRQDGHLTLTFVTEGIESAVTQAKAAAGDKAVTVVGGPGLIQQLLLAGHVDELQVDVMPVFLGAGARHFDQPGLESIRLEKIGTVEVGERTSLRFRVVR